MEFVTTQKTAACAMKIIINIDVPDLTAAVHFYTRAFDLTQSRTLDDDVAELTGSSSVIYLLRIAPGSAPVRDGAASRDYDRHWTPVHLDFVVDSLELAAQRAEQAGAQRESACVEWRGSRCMTFADPFGHGFCLIEFASSRHYDDDRASGSSA